MFGNMGFIKRWLKEITIFVGALGAAFSRPEGI